MKSFSNRLGITLAAATIVLFAGIHGVKAQDQAAMIADADGMEPPDTGFAYELPVNTAAVIESAYAWPELAALLADPDGMNSPNTGFAYELPVAADGFMAGQTLNASTNGLVFDADGLEPPDIGMAYAIEPAVNVVAERRAKRSR